MLKKILFVILLFSLVALSSGCFIQDTLSYIQSTDDIINTAYTLGIVGFALGWYFTQREK